MVCDAVLRNPRSELALKSSEPSRDLAFKLLRAAPPPGRCPVAVGCHDRHRARPRRASNRRKFANPAASHRADAARRPSARRGRVRVASGLTISASQRLPAGELVARGNPCVTGSVLNVVPYDGGLDLYLRWEANTTPPNPAYPGYRECFAQRRRSRRGRRPIRRAAARGAGAVQPAVRASGSEGDPVVVADREAGSCDSARAAGEMSSRAGAHITTIKAGHLSLITDSATSRR